MYSAIFRWTDQKEKSAAYLTWPDARLRAYLRERGISEAALPISRPGLLREYRFGRRSDTNADNFLIEETRIRWVQSQKRAETLFAKIKEIVNSGLYKADEVISHIMGLLKGDLDYASHKTNAAYDATKHKGEETWEDAKARGASAQEWAARRSGETWEEAKARGASAQDWAARKGDETWEEAKARGEAAQNWAGKKGDERIAVTLRRTGLGRRLRMPGRRPRLLDRNFKGSYEERSVSA